MSTAYLPAQSDIGKKGVCGGCGSEEYRFLGRWHVAVRWNMRSGGAVLLALRIQFFITSTAKDGHTIQRLVINRVFVMVVAWICTVVVAWAAGGVWELVDGRRGKTLQDRAQVQRIIRFAL